MRDLVAFIVGMFPYKYKRRAGVNLGEKSLRLTCAFNLRSVSRRVAGISRGDKSPRYTYEALRADAPGGAFSLHSRPLPSPLQGALCP
jgi:hypothetical protein